MVLPEKINKKYNAREKTTETTVPRHTSSSFMVENDISVEVAEQLLAPVEIQGEPLRKL